MIDAGIGWSQEEDAVLAAEEAIRRAKGNLNNESKIDLGLVFNSYGLSSAGAARAFGDLLPKVPIIGASGPAVISQEGILKHGLVLALLCFPGGVSYNTAWTRDISGKGSFASGKELSERLLFRFKSTSRNQAFLFFDRLIDDGKDFIAGFQANQANTGKNFPFICVALSSQNDLNHSWLYFNNDVFNNSCAGIILGGKITFGAGIKHGWKPLGKPHVVTNSVSNIINSIDEKPAVLLYEEYLGYDFDKLRKYLKKLSISYPIGVFIPGEEEYLLRNVISVEDRGALVCQGSIPEGSAIRLMISTPKTCLDAVTGAVKAAQKKLNDLSLKLSSAEVSRFAIVFSSISRYNLLRKDIKKELDFIKESLGGIPFLGIYAQGVMAPLLPNIYPRQIYSHNQDFSILIMEG